MQNKKHFLSVKPFTYVTYTFRLIVSTIDSSQSSISIQNTATIDILVNDAPTISDFYITST